ncbi:MAG: type II toxin-antitoxin system PemK/MazF family toxin [Ekhidna sp.]
MKQGELWYADLNPSKGSEQAGYRPVLIISGNMLNQHLKVVIVCPLTSQIKQYKGNLVLNPSKENNLKQKSEVLTFHIRSVSKIRLIEKIGNVEKKELELVHSSLGDILRY